MVLGESLTLHTPYAIVIGLRNSSVVERSALDRLDVGSSPTFEALFLRTFQMPKY